ncbi:MAG TPA: septal ring lytic transglycosylase RlpA family protein [Alphaproteobacteria bacterium]|nr:septal ring lytic transglycosylase RlpA family protein [Alphaproteobacteria bacterium]HAJ48743.1 septal ring lytic transglycosylase RlpA family protein [Alphaproteobacteria bacterium]
MVRTISVLMVSALGLAACATTEEAPTGPRDGHYKVGSPYQIKGVWYYPKEEPGYDETGIASWYGEPFHGRKTANGERYDMNLLTAAHRTLPLPSFVEVTNLENGKQVRLRVNDRGPYSRGRIIDVSKRAAELLGFKHNGVAKVRVQYAGKVKGSRPTSEVPAMAAPVASVSVEPLPGSNTGAKDGAVRTASLGPAIPMTDGSVEADDTVKQGQASPNAQIWIQTGAFENRGFAQRQASKLGGSGNVSISAKVQDGRTLHRVRIGPLADVGAADAKLDQVIGLGYNGAQIVVD